MKQILTKKSFDNVHIASVIMENVQKIQSLEIFPNQKGLISIGGGCNTGKTSVLKFMESVIKNQNTKVKAMKKNDSIGNIGGELLLSNGILLKVTNSGIKISNNENQLGSAGVIKQFFSDFALDVPLFLLKSDTEKAKMLLDSFGVGDDLVKLQKEAEVLKANRTLKYDAKHLKMNAAADLKYYEISADEKELSAQDIIDESQEALLINEKNAELRNKIPSIELNLNTCVNNIKINESSFEANVAKIAELNKLNEELTIKKVELNNTKAELELNLNTAKLSVADLKDKDTTAIKAKLDNIKAHNDALTAKKTANKNKDYAEEEAKETEREWSEADALVKENAKKQKELLSFMSEKLPGLELTNGEVVYEGFKFSELSTSHAIRAALGILKEISPECGFAFIDRLESLDAEQTKLIVDFAIENDIQLWGTKVSSNDDDGCDIIMQEGEAIVNKTLDNRITETVEVAEEVESNEECEF